MVKNRRRNFFINKDFQSRFILRFAGAATIWSVAAALLFTFFAKERLRDALYSSHLTLRPAGEFLMPTALYAHGIALVLFTLILAYAIHALWKRLAAPLFMLKKDIARITSGDLVNRVLLREEDEFQELAAGADAMRSELGAKFVRIKEQHGALVRAIAGLDRAFLQGLPLNGHVAAVKETAARFHEELDVFAR
jgi:methyl-accepting chemotaxis protein